MAMIEKYATFCKEYLSNKEIIKDSSYKTLTKFMKIFLKANSISDHDPEYFISDNTIDLFLLALYQFDENDLLNKEQEMINMIYINLAILGENYDKSQAKQPKANFITKWLVYFLKAFEIKKMLLNFNIYKKTIKFIINKSNEEIYLQSLQEQINKEKSSNEIIIKNKINTFLIYYYTINNNNNSNYNCNCNDYSFIDIFFDIKSIVQYSLSSSITTNEQMAIVNMFNHILDNYVNKLKQKGNDINDTKKQTTYSSFIISFIAKLNQSSIDAYENFIYILSSLLTIDNLRVYPQLLSILKNVLISNHSLIHKISVKFLNEISFGNSNDKTTINLNQSFIKKYISVFDVLDGFNCHLFKSLHPDIEAMLQIIDSSSTSTENKSRPFIDADGFYYHKNPTSFADFSSIEMNYFLLLSRKIFNHCNSRIQKYFVKLICKFKFKSSIFDYYFTNDYFNIINNPLLYPENEAITYHNKVGVLIEQFYYEYLLNNERLISAYLKSLGLLISNRRIFTYLFNALMRVLQKREESIQSKSAIEMIEVTHEVLLSVIEAQMKTYSYYNKRLYWKTICLLISQINKKGVDFIKIYYELLSYVMNDSSLSLESIRFGKLNDSNSRLWKKTLCLMLNAIKATVVFTSESKNSFIEKNALQKYSNDAITSVYYSLLIVIEPQSISDLFKDTLKKIFSSYYPTKNKKEILKDMTILIELINYYHNCKENEHEHEIGSGLTKIELENDIFEEFYYSIKSYRHSAINTTSSIKTQPSNEILFMTKSIDSFNKILLSYMQISTQAIVANDFIQNQFDNHNNIMITDNEYSVRYIKMLLLHLLSSIHFNILKPFDYYSNKTLANNLQALYSLICPKMETKHKVLQIEILTLCLLSLDTFHLSYDITAVNHNEYISYFDIVQDYGLYYCLKLYNLVYMKYAPIEDFIAFIDKGVKILTEKRDNLTYINVVTFLQPIITKSKVSSDLYQKAIIDFFNRLIYLNDNRTWLLLKIASELLIDIIKERIDLIAVYEDVIIKLAISKETRGDDSSILDTSPMYIKSPFNIKTHKLIHHSRDDYKLIAKYGLYIRYGILDLFEKLIQDTANPNSDSIVLSMLLNVIKQIDALSRSKPEMQYTEKHRKKLRLAQFLLVLGSIFLVENNDTVLYLKQCNKDLIDQIEVIAVSLFKKLNLFSVNFYLNLFYVFLGKSRQSFRMTLLDYLNNPKLKPHIVSPALIILSILLVEKCIKSKREIDNVINAITVQCTSNVCNIRGYAQFFINKLNSLSMISNTFLSHKFLEYLNSNDNILRFFSKFNDKYNILVYLINHFSVENILKNNFDELLAEIIPIDISNEFKLLSVENVPLENQDFTNPQISWRYAFDIDYNKAQEPNDKNSSSNNKEFQIEDFQKKYRPIENDIYHNIKRKRLDVIVMASLIDKAPNLGGLARTCEVFNIGAMTVNSDEVVKDIAFLSAAASAERWMPLITIPPSIIKEFIAGYKKMGYAIIGLEQTQNSVPIKDFKFKEKCVIVLGNEKEGIPQELINLIDTCIIIPQYGEIRSLNVHVSAAIMLWDLVNCIQK